LKRTIAVIPAAGRAQRFGGSANKIWSLLDGRTVLDWTLSAFASHPQIDGIIVVASEDELERVRSATSGTPKILEVVVGGETRAESVKKGLDALPDEAEIVLVHDAARPFVTAKILTDSIEAVERTGASVPGTPLSDTVKRVGTDRLVKATVPRTFVVGDETLTGLTAVQTPQGARVSVLRIAYDAFDFALGEPTDEASLIEAAGLPVEVVSGDPINLKITRQDDLDWAQRILRGGIEKEHEDQTTANTQPSFGEIRTGFGYDVHAFAAPSAGRTLYLGGVAVPHDRGLEGHSDADVLLHAIADALLGAASLGDIGILFPNTDERYRGISSLRLLSVVGERLNETEWHIVNIDATVVAEAPRLMPYRAEMMQTIASCLGLEASRVSIKATTSEKMGFVGRGEGMASWAVATIKKGESR